MTEPPPLPPDLQAAHERLMTGAAEILPRTGLAEKLVLAQKENRPLRVKHGIDPSGTELTLGHAVVQRKLRQFQDLGHLVVLIIGDFTGMVGDPSGRSATRKQLSAEETAANSATYVEQLMRILDPEKVEIRRNSEWLAPMTMADVIRESANLTVAHLLERDDFAKRFAARTPISLSEFMYPLLQGYDSVAVEADVELGGTDQTYNLLVGRDLQRAHGQPQQTVLTVPLLEGLDGVQKMSKSLNNYVAIAEPPGEQFGKLMSIPDSMIVRYATLCADFSPDELAGVAREVDIGGPSANAAKRAVARAVVGLYHGTDAAKAADAAFDQVFRNNELPTDVPEFPLPADDPVHLPALLVSSGLAASTSEARRALKQGSVKLDGERVEFDALDLDRSALAGRILQVGKRRSARLLG
ncbi:MAG TPA: tyrosine--tRNA ligase [Mycobacteriales bacterium]|nr:tyrosine--tRNA ligase [Mycobacteriales bacterium]